MTVCNISTYTNNNVTLLGNVGLPGRVTFAFSERNGGVSLPPFSSLNVGSNCNDDIKCVVENRRRVMQCLNVSSKDQERLIVPNQVHEDAVLVVRDVADVKSIQESAQKGCDAVVCCCSHVPVMLCYADCVPVILVCEKGFAVIHSGWRGTFLEIAGKALKILCENAQVEPDCVKAYIGPHIQGSDYEVSEELLDKFVNKFGNMVRCGKRNLSMSAAIKSTLELDGVLEENIYISDISTPQATSRYFSYRKEEGLCGRHGAIAYLSSSK